MTPKEKAKELVKGFYKKIFDGGTAEEANDAWYQAKECALFHISEVLNVLHEKDNLYYYYIEVQNEVEML